MLEDWKPQQIWRGLWGLRYRPQHWPTEITAAGPGQAKRDLRLDFFRGWALIFIFIDHTSGSIVPLFTLQSFTFCDAAEVFVFISGYVAGLVYFGLLERRGPLHALAWLYRRVWQLYIANIFVFVVYAALVTYVFSAAGDPGFVREAGLGTFLNHPSSSIAELLLLLFQPPYFDILPLYIVLLAFFPFVLLLLRGHPLLPLVPSVALYLAAHHFGWKIDLYPHNQGWSFNPFDWQLIFVLGAVCWRMGSSGRRLISDARWVQLGAAIFVTLCAFVTVTHAFHTHPSFRWLPVLFPAAPWEVPVDKSDLSLLRLANFIALAIVAAWLVRRDAAFLSGRAARAVRLCGQNSLNIFCLGILLSAIGSFVLTQIADPKWLQLVVAAAGVAIMIATGYVITWYKRVGRSMSIGTAPGIAN